MARFAACVGSPGNLRAFRYLLHRIPIVADAYARRSTHCAREAGGFSSIAVWIWAPTSNPGATVVGVGAVEGLVDDTSQNLGQLFEIAFVARRRADEQNP
jgi:hypothetical protein